MATKFNKQILRVVVGQVCQTIGWNGINSTALEVLIDVLHRYLLEITRTTHLYSDQFGRTQPNLDDLGLAFSEMGIDITELHEYVDFVDSVSCNLNVPKYPVHKESHLNFLKPGSQEVVTRPVHVNEHLPPTVELSVEVNAELGGSPQPSPTFKRPGEPIESGPAKRARLGFEDEGRPLREISSVMMTTGGFISAAREGKMPESRIAFPASDFRSASPPNYPSAPPEVNRESKKKSPDVVKERVKEKDKEKKKEKRLNPAGELSGKKHGSSKEWKKLKAFKTSASKHSHNPVSTPAPAPEKTLLQKLSESPHLVITPVPPEPAPPAVKLATEPDKQKLNIFKKISKVKEEEPSISIIKDEPSFSSPGSPSTPKTPDILKSPEHKKKKKDKDRDRDREKKKRHKDSDKSRQQFVESERRPKTPEVPISLPPPTFPFFPPGLVPPVISNPLIPRFPGPLGPNFPNLPLPPSFLQHAKPDVTIEPVAATSKSPLAILLNEKKENESKKDKEHKKEKKEKKKKKDKDKDKEKDKGKEKDKDKEKVPKDKPKKEKKEKKHSEERHKDKEHKSKDKKEKKEKRKEKERSREKEREKEREREREKEIEKEKVKVKEISEKVKEIAVPKLTLKIGTPTSSRAPSPKRAAEEEPPRRAVLKVDDHHKKDKTGAEQGDIARISSLFSKPPKEQKPLHVQTDSLKVPKEDSNLQKSPGTIIDKDGNKVWICPSCGRPDDGTPMIGCDECDAWYHWVCVGIQVPPDENENWYCRFCIVKKQGSHSKKKRGRKKKPPV